MAGISKENEDEKVLPYLIKRIISGIKFFLGNREAKGNRTILKILYCPKDKKTAGRRQCNLFYLLLHLYLLKLF